MRTFCPHVNPEQPRIAVFMFFSELFSQNAIDEILELVDVSQKLKTPEDYFEESLEHEINKPYELEMISFSEFENLKIKDIKIISEISFIVLRYECERYFFHAFMNVAIKDQKYLQENDEILKKIQPELKNGEDMTKTFLERYH